MMTIPLRPGMAGGYRQNVPPWYMYFTKADPDVRCNLPWRLDCHIPLQMSEQSPAKSPDGSNQTMPTSPVNIYDITI